MLPPPIVLAAVPEVLRIAKWVYDHGFKSRVEGAPGKLFPPNAARIGVER
jgi:hypothetical protein